ncbi:MAG: hypothetical protein ACKVII_05710 [Planctomycetales bacterium]|jgi:hypothetical protein
MKNALLFLIICLMVVCSSATAQEQKTWAGKWNNRKYGTSGPLKCVAGESRAGQWNAVFTGTFKGDPFEFRAAFLGKAGRQSTDLSGQSTIRGAKYQWTGKIQGRQLTGSYKGANGNYGEFTLNESGGTGRSSSPNSAPTTTGRSTSPYEIKDGDKLLFIGNSFMANEGGVHNYLAAALQKNRVQISVDKQINYGKPLREMMKPEVRSAIEAGDASAVVITSGQLNIMKQFDGGIRKAGMKTVVFMTWETRHPGNRASTSQYTEATRKAVREMRQMEHETGATIVPAAVAFHSLTVQPPEGMPRIDYLWKPRNIHQNEIGTMVNAWLFYSVLTGNSPVGMNFDMPPYIVGQKVKSEPSIRFTRDLRTALQERVWEVAQAWKAGKSHLD